jgi:hypothetical protein
MEKRTQPFFDRFTATQDRPKTFQVFTIILFLLIVLSAATGIIARLLRNG